VLRPPQPHGNPTVCPVHRADAGASRLSGSGRQRVSIARSPANERPILIAEKPTAPPHVERAPTGIRILDETARRSRMAIIVVAPDE